MVNAGCVDCLGTDLGCTGTLLISHLFVREENTELPGVISLWVSSSTQRLPALPGFPWTWGCCKGAVQNRLPWKTPPSPALPSQHCPVSPVPIHGAFTSLQAWGLHPTPASPLRGKTFPDLQPKPALHNLRPSPLVPREKGMRSTSRIWKTPPPSLHYSSQKSRFTQKCKPSTKQRSQLFMSALP